MEGRTVVAKFGGGLHVDKDAISTSEKIKKAAEIVLQDPSRRYVVIAAPGSISEEDFKVTDMLYICQSRYANKENHRELFDKICDRYTEIVNGLGINFDLDAEFNALKRCLILGKIDATVSRGEYIMAKIFAEYLGWPFVDAAELIYFKNDFTLNQEKTFAAVKEKLGPLDNAVVPGFYGVMPTGNIKTFSRGGSDITGAILARALNADLYEKWTENARIYSADTTLINNPERVRYITYNEMRELSYMGGVNMLHEDVLLLLQDVQIPINVRNMNDLDSNGTLITTKIPENSRKVAACIGGMRNFKCVKITKFGLNKLIGIGAKMFSVFARYNVPFEHCLVGIDTVAAVLKSPIFDLRRDEILRELEGTIKPNSVTVEKDLSLISIIGEGMGTVKGVFAKAFNALADADIKVRMLDQGSDTLALVIGVYDEDYETAIRALYQGMILN